MKRVWVHSRVDSLPSSQHSLILPVFAVLLINWCSEPIMKQQACCRLDKLSSLSTRLHLLAQFARQTTQRKEDEFSSSCAHLISIKAEVKSAVDNSLFKSTVISRANISSCSLFLDDWKAPSAMWKSQTIQMRSGRRRAGITNSRLKAFQSAFISRSILKLKRK